MRKPDSAVALPDAPRWLQVAVLALAGLFLLGLFSTELADSDAWWHLASGRYVAETHHLPAPDPFAYTTAGAGDAYAGEAATRHFNLTHEWLAQLAMYGLETVGGSGAVVAGKALLLALLCAAVGWTALARTKSLLWGIAAALAAASLAVEFAHDRPSILSYVLAAVFVAICERRQRLWLLPALSLVWANCHGGYFLGWVIVGAYTAEALLRAADSRRWLAVCLATIVASGLNPNGFGALMAVWHYRRSPLQASLMEWSPASLWGSPYAFDLLLYAAALAMILSWRRVRPVDWLLAGAFAAAALTAFRNEMLVGVVAPILIADYFPKRRGLPRQAQYAAGAVLAAGLLWGAGTGRFFQLRAAEWRFPAGAARFLSEHDIHGPIFNTYEYGGYLIWQGERVFIDGRALSERVFQDYRLILGSPPGDPARARTLEHYGVTAIVANGFEYNSGTLYPLVPSVTSSPADAGWYLVYEDPQALVFVRHVPAGVAVLPSGRVDLHLERECSLHVERDPEFSLCARTLASLYLRAGDRQRAKQWLRYYLDHPYGDDPEAQRAYLQLFRR